MLYIIESVGPDGMVIAMNILYNTISLFAMALNYVYLKIMYTLW